jgi:hypothetical protein
VVTDTPTNPSSDELSADSQARLVNLLQRLDKALGNDGQLI